ncbi:MAG: aspartate aminotransferase family protein [Arenicella sp.]
MIKNLLQRFQRKNGNNSALMNTYKRLPIAFTKGEGMQLWDDNDKSYLDALGGIAVTVLGHKHPQFTAALKEQADQILHTSNLFQIPAQETLGKKLCEISGMDKVFITNSGAEANEAAIKLARKHGNDQGIVNPVIITAENSFHGRTMATLSATGNDAIKAGFSPLLKGFVHVPYNNVDAITSHADNSDVVAVMLEPIQGEAGIIIPDEDYLTKVRAVCDDNNWLLITDEIQSGIGRTGKWCAQEHAGISADVITFAKALGNGIPIGACAARGKAAEVLGQGNHGTTFGGNPFACSMASEVLAIIEQDNLLEHMAEIGDYLLNSLKLNLGNNDKVADIRGKGLMLAVELNAVYDDLIHRFLAAGLIVNITGGGKTIRLLPPAIMQKEEADSIAKTIATVIRELN